MSTFSFGRSAANGLQQPNHHARNGVSLVEFRDCTFVSAAELEVGGGESRTPVAKAARPESGTVDRVGPGWSDGGADFARSKVRLAVSPDVISCKRISKVPTSLQVLKGMTDEATVFEIRAKDAFTVVTTRKRSLVIMATHEGRPVCFTIRFGKKRDRNKAHGAMAGLPGHIHYGYSLPAQPTKLHERDSTPSNSFHQSKPKPGPSAPAGTWAHATMEFSLSF